MRRRIVSCLSIACFLLAPLLAWAEPSTWEKLDEGLLYGKFDPPEKTILSRTYPVTVLRIDPRVYSLKLLCASESDGESKTAKHWCTKYGLAAAINASMYLGDHRTSTGYMRKGEHINNPHVNPGFGAFLVFGPTETSLPEVQLLDSRQQKGWKALIEKYHTVIQNYRLIALEGRNAWKPSDKMYSTAAVGMDRSGHVLFIFCRSPFSTHDFNNILLTLPLDIKNAMYLEGGPEASLYINVNGKEKLKMGSYETGFSENDHNQYLWRIPNIIGIVKKASQ